MEEFGGYVVSLNRDYNIPEGSYEVIVSGFSSYTPPSQTIPSFLNVQLTLRKGIDGQKYGGTYFYDKIWRERDADTKEYLATYDKNKIRKYLCALREEDIPDTNRQGDSVVFKTIDEFEDLIKGKAIRVHVIPREYLDKNGNTKTEPRVVAYTKTNFPPTSEEAKPIQGNVLDISYKNNEPTDEIREKIKKDKDLPF
jgi:hypothetical protein